MNTSTSDITLAVLAGGEGSRMGRPKALLRVNGRPILDLLLDQFAWDGPTLLVTAPGRERPPGAQRFGREVVDPPPGRGPLRGVLTALEYSATDFVIVAAVDMPVVARQHLLQLVGAMQAGAPPRCALFTRSAMVHDHIQPFPGCFRADAQAILRDQLTIRRFSVVALAQLPGFTVMDLGWSSDVYLNLNEPDDLESLRRTGLTIE